jgi:glucokinase
MAYPNHSPWGARGQNTWWTLIRSFCKVDVVIAGGVPVLAAKHQWMEPSLLIAGDIGGTKTLLAIYDFGDRARWPILQVEYHSADCTALDVMIREFLATSHCEAGAARFAVAGPVIEGRAHLTNLPWTVDVAALHAELALDEVFLLNDLQATASPISDRAKQRPKLRA